MTLDWPLVNAVDLLCLQELKMTDDQFPLEVLKATGHSAAVFGHKSYNGVAILSLSPVRDLVTNIIGSTYAQSRIIEAMVDTSLPCGPPPGGAAGACERLDLPDAKRVELDAEYVSNWSLWLDLKMMFKTLKIVATGDGSQ